MPLLVLVVVQASTARIWTRTAAVGSFGIANIRNATTGTIAFALAIFGAVLALSTRPLTHHACVRYGLELGHVVSRLQHAPYFLGKMSVVQSNPIKIDKKKQNDDMCEW
jgi:hypothetical protein